jgi:hypothetical protein
MLPKTLTQRTTPIIRGAVDRETGGEEAQFKWRSTGDTIAIGLLRFAYQGKDMLFVHFQHRDASSG